MFLLFLDVFKSLTCLWGFTSRFEHVFSQDEVNAETDQHAEAPPFTFLQPPLWILQNADVFGRDLGKMTPFQNGEAVSYSVKHLEKPLKTTIKPPLTSLPTREKRGKSVGVATIRCLFV